MNGEYRIILKYESSKYFYLGYYNSLKDIPSTAVYVRIYSSHSVVPGTYCGEIIQGSESKAA
jgi:hypothetical protein